MCEIRLIIFSLIFSDKIKSDFTEILLPNKKIYFP